MFRANLLAVTVCLAAPAQEPPAIRVPVRLVTVPALVFSAGNRLVPGLRASNFRLLDDGRPQPVTVDEAATPLSVAVVVHVSRDVRAYVPFIARTGAVIDALVAGAAGDSAVVAYADDVAVLKPFGAGDAQAALHSISVQGRGSRLLDAGARAIALLAERPAAHTRVLLFIGQSIDSGSEVSLASLQQLAEKENIVVFALALPLLGKAFVSDTFSLQGVSKAERGGYRAGTDLGNLVRILNGASRAAGAADPFSTLAAATGGMQQHFRTQRQLEDGLSAIGFQLRSAYVLTYRPAGDPGYHTVKVEVDLPGAKVYARPGYWLAAN
jgi:VWFA-related protein